ncbi:ema [Scenedesmus sp. PABB004]|nr:ema [Scenedesmus sp. PABB004]
MALVVAAGDDRSEPEVIARLPAAPGSRLAFSWGLGTQVRVAAVAGGAAAPCEDPHAAVVEWSPPVGEQRRIAYDIAPLYRCLRQTLALLGPGRQVEAKEALREYSAGVLDILTTNASDPAAGPPASEEALQVAYEAGLWSLLELFFLSSDTPEGFFAEARPARRRPPARPRGAVARRPRRTLLPPPPLHARAQAFAAWLGQHGGLMNATPGFHALAAEARRLAGLQRVDSEASYWPTLQRLVLTGQLEAGIALLTAHPAYAALQDPDMAAKVEVLDVVYQLLRTVPRFSRAGGSAAGRLGGAGALTDDVVVFSAERAAWRRRVDELWEGREALLADLKKLDPAASKGLAGVLCLLCAGSDHQAHAAAAFKLMSAVAHNWAELLAGTLLWKYPTLQPQLHLRHLVPKVQAAAGLVTRDSDEAFLACLEQVGVCGGGRAARCQRAGRRRAAPLAPTLAPPPRAAQLLLASCDQEVQSVVSLCTNSPYCSLQFVAHVYDVLRGAPGAERVIARPLPHLGGDQAELFALHYVETLLGHAPTWQLAAEYLAWCPVHGAAALEAALDRSPVRAERRRRRGARAGPARRRAGLGRSRAHAPAGRAAPRRAQFPLQDERSALKAIALAQRHGLTAAAAGLARRLSAAAAASGRPAAALQWAMRGNDPARCAELVAPLVAKVQAQLLEQAGDFRAPPLELPELRELAPLLACLPEPRRGSDDGGAPRAWGAPQGRPYPELHFLRAVLQLQDALALVRRAQGLGGPDGAPCPPEPAALGDAYAAVRRPAAELLLEGLAPAAVRLPLLLHLVPVLESAHAPFTRADVAGLLALLSGADGGLPAAAAAVLAGMHAPGAGLAWPAAGKEGSGGGGLAPRHLADRPPGRATAAGGEQRRRRAGAMLSTKGFFALFKPAVAKFSEEELRELYQTLLRNPVVGESNRALVVETIRRIAEYMIWADQHDPRLFDFFLENNIMTYLHRVLLQPANRAGEVAKQVLQTLSIIIQNVRSETAVFFLFSNNHVNNIVDLDYDFDDEEVLGYYVSFLKTIALRLNAGTAQFFINAAPTRHGAPPPPPGGAGAAAAAGSFPLYARAIALAHNREGMVRAAVRTLTLHVYSVPDAAIADYVTRPPAAAHFAEVAAYLAEQVMLLDRRLAAAEAGGGTALGSLDSQLAEVEDVLSYVSDLLSLGVPRISQLLADAVWQRVVEPLLLRPLMRPGAVGSAAAQPPAHLQQQSRAGVPGGRAALLGGGPSGSPRAFTQLDGGAGGPPGSGSGGRQAPRVRPVCSVFVLERVFQLVTFAPLLQQLLLALACGGGGEGGAGSAGVSCRATLLGLLGGGQPYPAVMALRLLVALLHNRHISTELLCALSLLPRRRRAQPGADAGAGGGGADPGQLALLVQAALAQLRGSGGGGGGAGLQPPSPVDLLTLLTQQYLPGQLLGTHRSEQQQQAPASAGGVEGLEAWLEQQAETAAAAPGVSAAVASSAFGAFGPQLLDALLRLLQLPELPPQGLRLLGWLLHQLLPPAPPAADELDDAADAGVPPPQQQVKQAQGQQAQEQQQQPASPPRHRRGASSSSMLPHPLAEPVGELSDGSSSPTSAGAGGASSSSLSRAASDDDSLADSSVAAPPVSTTAPSLRSFMGGAEAPGGCVLSADQAAAVAAAVASAAAAFSHQLGSMWCEAVFPLLAAEWAACREALQRPVLRAGADALLSGTAAWPLLLGLQAQAAAGESGGGAPPAGLEALSVSGRAALGCFLAVQRVVALTQLRELLASGAVPAAPPVATLSEAELKQVDIQEGFQVDLAPGSALPCVVSFAPGQERRVYFAVAGLSRKQLTAMQAGGADAAEQAPGLLHSLPVAVLADPSPSRAQAGIVLSVAPLLGARPYADAAVPKWLHVHVRPSVRGLTRVIKTAAAKKGGLLAAMRQLADGHWVLAFSTADKAAGAVALVEQHTAHLRRLYSAALAPLTGPQAQAELAVEEQLTGGEPLQELSEDQQQQQQPPPQQQQQQQPQQQQLAEGATAAATAAGERAAASRSAEPAESADLGSPAPAGKGSEHAG